MPTSQPSKSIRVRDPTFPDIPTFKEVCNATPGCSTSGEAWEAWKAFMIAGFPAQKMIVLPRGTPQEVIDAYKAAFEAIIARPDFRAISEQTLGIYPQMTGKAAANAFALATTIDEKSKAYVRTWLVNT